MKAARAEVLTHCTADAFGDVWRAGMGSVLKVR
jgi:hypothetical protein